MNFPIPSEELLRFQQDVAAAVLHAERGDAATGYRLLDLGLAFAEEAGDPWRDELVAQYRTGLVTFAMAFGVWHELPIGSEPMTAAEVSDHLSRWSTLLRSQAVEARLSAAATRQAAQAARMRAAALRESSQQKPGEELLGQDSTGSA